MNRREFIGATCTTCLSLTVIAALLPSCTATKYIQGSLDKNGLKINRDEFKIIQKGNTTSRSFIIIRNESLKYPICVYKLNDEEYSALWMECSHQGAELQAVGDFLQCNAHGSEFDKKGIVRSGPANRNLRVFPVTVSKNELFIDLRA